MLEVEEEYKVAIFNLNHSIAQIKIPFDNPFESAKGAERQEARMSEKNIRLITEFLKERKKVQNNETTALARLKEQRKNKLIDKATYCRLREELALSRELKKIEILYLITRKSAKRKAAAKN